MARHRKRFAQLRAELARLGGDGTFSGPHSDETTDLAKCAAEAKLPEAPGLSAGAVLNGLTPEVTLEVYHNRHAEFALVPAQLSHQRIRHFKSSLKEIWLRVFQAGYAELVPKSPKKTRSETLFESFCAGVGIVCRPIKTASGKRTPDYELASVQPIPAVAEVKQLDPNPEEKRAIKELWKDGITSVSDRPGRRVFLKISDAVPQLTRLAKGVRPAILVLYDNVRLSPAGINPYHVRVGMYGLEQVRFEAPPVGSEDPARFIGYRLGGRRKTTPKDNTTLSAVAVLNDRTSRITLDVYHNCYATIPLDVSGMSHPRITHFRLAKGRGGRRGKWVKIAPKRRTSSPAKGKKSGGSRPVSRRRRKKTDG